MLSSAIHKAKALLWALVQVLRRLGRSILGTSRNSTTAGSDMDIIPGYWDPRNLCFIEESESDQLELCSVGAAELTRSSSDAACASTPESAVASGKTKIC